MDGWDAELLLSWRDAAMGVVAGVGIYLAVIIVTRIFGQRSLTSVSSFDFPVTVAVGAIVGRTALVHTSLLGGMIALGTLFSIQAAVGWMRQHTALGGIVDNPPVLLMSRGRFLERNLRRAHMSREDVIERLRGQGVASLNDVAVVVLERSGGVSVIQGERVEAEMLRNVAGLDEAEGVEPTGGGHAADRHSDSA